MTWLDSSEKMNKVFNEFIDRSLRLWHNRCQTGQIGDYDFFDADNIVALFTSAINKNPSDLNKAQFDLACDIIDWASPQFEAKGAWSTWVKVLHGAVRSGERIGTPAQLTMLYHYYGRSLLALNRYVEGEGAYRKAIRLARQMEDTINEARACSNLGYYYINRGHWARSEALCLHALQKFEVLQHDHGISHTNNHLGLLYTRQARWAQAASFLHEAIKIWREIDQPSLFHGYMNLGLLDFEQGVGEGAIRWSEKALDIAQQLEDIVAQGRAKNNIAIGYVLMQEYDKAKRLLREAIEIGQSYGDVVGIARSQLNIGKIYLMQGKHQRGMPYLDIAFEVFSQINDGDAMITILDFLTDYQITCGQIEQAKETSRRLETVVNNHHWGSARSDMLYRKIKAYKAQLN